MSHARSSEITPRDQNLGFRADIEGLRAIAVLLVVAFHAGIPAIGGGFIGVDVFFVISGYLITKLLLKQVEADGRLDVLQFYGRRARRLLPALSLTLVTVIVACNALCSPLELRTFSKSAIATSLYASNVWFIRSAEDYFAPSVQTNPLLHTWSLAVEEQFYFVWPLVIGFCLRLRSRRALIGVVAAIIVLSYPTFVWLSKTRPAWAFYGMPMRAWEFGIGALLTLMSSEICPSVGCRRWLGFSGFVCILAAGVFLPEAHFPAGTAAVPVLGTAAVLFAGDGTRAAIGINAFLQWPALQWIGRLSYSWYLWHWPALVVTRALVPDLSMWGALAIATGALLLAAATHRVVEVPVRHSYVLARHPMNSVGLAFGLSLACVSIGLFSTYANSQAARLPPFSALASAQSTEFGLPPNCVAEFADARLHSCGIGDTSANHTVVVFGDSHAEQWMPAIAETSQAKGWRVITLLKSSCPVAAVTAYNPHLKRAEGECTSWRDRALLRIVGLRPDLVIIGSSVGYIKSVGGKNNGYANISLSEWANGLRATLKVLNDARIHTVLLRDTPRPDFDVPMCLAREAAHPVIYSHLHCVIKADEVLYPVVWNAEVRACQGLSYVRPLDLLDRFCGGQNCPAVVDGVIVYRDGNHMTAAFSSLLAPLVSERMLMAHLEADVSKRTARAGSISAP